MYVNLCSLIFTVKTDSRVTIDKSVVSNPQGTSSSLPLHGINVENASRPMKFLQRVVKSLLRQMNVRVRSVIVFLHGQVECDL
jgi:hypothetical protein